MAKRLETKIGGSRRIVTETDPKDIRYVRTSLISYDGKIIDSDGPFPSKDAKSRHAEMVARNTSL